MRLLVADKIYRPPLEELSILGVDVVHNPSLTADDLPDAAKDAAILVVRSTQVTRAAIQASPQLSLIVRAGAGVNTIDVTAASELGVYVANCPGRNGAAVAELALGLVLALDRRLLDATESLREGRWEKSRFAAAPGILGRRIGIAGFGAIGKLVAKRAKAFGMEVHAWSRSLSPGKAQQAGVKHCASLLELARSVDVLSLHMPLNEGTRHIVDKRILEALPDDAILINTARAEVMDYGALREVLQHKPLRVGLDVLDGAPKDGDGSIDPAIFTDTGEGMVYGTPHIGASTEQAQRAIAHEVGEIIRAFLTEEEVPNVVNVCRNTPARWALVLRARDEVGVLANVLNVIKRHGLNIEEIANTVFEGAAAACTKLRLSGRPGEDCLNEIRAFDEVLHVDVVQLPNLA